MTESLTLQRELSPQETFDQLYSTCRWDGVPQQVRDARVTLLEYAFFTGDCPEFSNTDKIHKIGQSFSHVSSSTHGRIIDFNVMPTDAEYGLAAVKTPTERPYSIIKMVDTIDVDQLELTGTYIVRSNEDPDAPLEIFTVFKDESDQLRLAALNNQDRAEVEYYLEGLSTEV